jgi:hypothetical protein
METEATVEGEVTTELQYSASDGSRFLDTNGQGIAGSGTENAAAVMGLPQEEHEPVIASVANGEATIIEEVVAKLEHTEEHSLVGVSTDLSASSIETTSVVVTESSVVVVDVEPQHMAMDEEVKVPVLDAKVESQLVSAESLEGEAEKVLSEEPLASKAAVKEEAEAIEPLKMDVDYDAQKLEEGVEVPLGDMEDSVDQADKDIGGDHYDFLGEKSFCFVFNIYCYFIFNFIVIRYNVILMPLLPFVHLMR